MRALVNILVFTSDSDFTLEEEEACLILRYESSNLIIYKELSSPIFQSCLSGIGNTCPDLHFVQYIKA